MAELYAVVGEQDNEQSLVASAQSLKASLSLDGLLLTRSEDGMTLFETG